MSHVTRRKPEESGRSLLVAVAKAGTRAEERLFGGRKRHVKRSRAESHTHSQRKQTHPSCNPPHVVVVVVVVVVVLARFRLFLLSKVSNISP
jgi:hypothetical protein